MRDGLVSWHSRSCKSAYLPVATQFAGVARHLHSYASQMASPSNYSKYDATLSYYDVFVSYVQEFFVLYKFCLKKSSTHTMLDLWIIRSRGCAPPLPHLQAWLYYSKSAQVRKERWRAIPAS